MRGSPNRQFQKRTDIAAFAPLAKVNCNGIAIDHFKTNRCAFVGSKLASRSKKYPIRLGNRCREYVCVAQVLPRNGCSVKKTCMGCVVCREKMHECRLDGPHLRRTRGRDPPQTVSPLTHPLTPRLASRALMRVASLACAGPAKRSISLSLAHFARDRAGHG